LEVGEEAAEEQAPSEANLPLFEAGRKHSAVDVAVEGVRGGILV